LVFQQPVRSHERQDQPVFKEDLTELIHYKDLLYNLVVRDLTVRYKRSVLGFFWSMLNPLLNTIVFTIVFSTIFRFGVKNFIIYFLAGFQLWNFFAQSTQLASSCLLRNGPLFKKIYIPKPIFVISTVLSNMVNLAFALIPLFILLPILGKGFHLSLLFLPVAILFAVMFTIGISFVLSATAIFFNDIIDMYQIFIMPWMYLTPIVYPIDIIPKKFIPFLKLNPMYYIVECFRWPIYMGELPNFQIVCLALLVSVASLVIGYLVFTKLSDTFVYYV
jgi:ABC-2 type transport system permease protein